MAEWPTHRELQGASFRALAAPIQAQIDDLTAQLTRPQRWMLRVILFGLRIADRVKRSFRA